MYRSIIVPVDGSRLAERAIAYAELIARASKASLVILQVVPPAGPNATDEATAAQADEIVQAQTHVDELASRVAAGILPETAVAVGMPAAMILEEAGERHADLIVMSTHGRSGVGRWIYGSVADDIMRHSSIPVLLIPAHSHYAWPTDRSPRIVVPLDGSELSKRALPAATELADSLSAELLLVQAVELHPPMYGDPSAYVMVDPTIELEGAETRLERLATELRSGGRKVEVAEMLGFAVTSVIDITRERGIDVIVMSTHGSGGLTRLIMGSVASGIIQRSNVPVLVVRPPATAT